jgi:diadenosine tetraphosphatase ApaH/serine/threonine PP2A family protein phosphatase
LRRQTIFTSVSLQRVLAALYDIHGNVPALEAAIADAKAAGATRWLLGGDFASWSPWPGETIALLRTLPDATWVRGNGERWLRELPWDRPEVAEELEDADSGLGTDEGWVYSLQAQAELDGVLYVHGCPLRDDDSFAKEPMAEDFERLAGIHNRTVVFGHSHIQFQRPGPSGTYLVNPGSVGMPLDGDVRGAYALWHGAREFEFRRVEYDNEKAAAAYEALGPPIGEFAAKRLRKGSD